MKAAGIKGSPSSMRVVMNTTVLGRSNLGGDGMAVFLFDPCGELRFHLCIRVSLGEVSGGVTLRGRWWLKASGFLA